MSPFITTSSAWTIDDIEKANREIGRIAKEKYGLETFPNQIEIITSEQMIDIYSSIGLPVFYHHWALGKDAESTRREYLGGHTNLAYELVINSNPAIAYLMEENTSAMQFLVIAHACYGHNSFFKGNYLFRQWTSPDAIVDYMIFARNFILECEERHGAEEVELFLDSCRALSLYGVDRYQRTEPLSLEKEKALQRERAEYLQSQVNDLWDRTVPKIKKETEKRERERFPIEPQENILYFIEKSAPLIEPWQREIVRIVRKIAQYFYPQRRTKVMNEGWASFWHFRLMYDLYEEGFLPDGFMIEWLASHTSVIKQPRYNETAKNRNGEEINIYSGINPYALGINIWNDIKRICENPTKEDLLWFPDIAGSNWLETFDFAMRNFKDESFILQYLSPKVMRNMKLFSVVDDADKVNLIIESIHNEDGYRQLRQSLSGQYNIGTFEPDIQIWNVDLRNDRTLTLRHTERNRVPLHKESALEVLKHLFQLWQCPVRIEAVKEDGKIEFIAECPSKQTKK